MKRAPATAIDDHRHRLEGRDVHSALPLFMGIEAPPTVSSPPPAAARSRARAPARTSMNTDDRARLLTIAEVADRLQCGRTYVYALLQKGILRAVKLGRLTRIPLAELEEFIAHKVADAPYDVCERWSRGGDRAAM